MTLSRFKSREFVLAFTSVTVGVLGVAASIYYQFTTFSSKGVRESDSQWAKLQDDTRRIDAKVDRLLELTKAMPDDAKLGLAYANLQAEVDRLKQEIAGFEIALGDDPGKKLAVPILRNELDNLKETYRSDLAAIRDEMKGSIELMKWVLGIIGITNLGVGLLGFRKGRVDTG